MALPLTVFVTSAESAMQQDDAPVDLHEHNKPAARREKIISAIKKLPIEFDLVQVVPRVALS